MVDNLDESTLTGLEQQVDELVKQIDDVLKLGGGSTRGPKSPDDDVKGSGKANLGDWKRPEKKHTHQSGSPVRGMVGKSAPDEGGEAEPDLEKALEDAAGLLGVEKAELAVALMALDKAKKKPAFLDNGNGNGNGNNGDDDGNGDEDEDDMDSNPTKKVAPEGEGESVIIEGERIAKADVGEAVFNVLQKQATKIDTQGRDIQKAKDEAEMERLRKRADDLYHHVPGSTEERAQMLRVMAGLSEPMKKAFDRVFVQSEKLAKAAFEPLGFGGKDPEEMAKTRRDFDTKISEIAKRDSCSRTDALRKARLEDPEGFKAYQGNGN